MKPAASAGAQMAPNLVTLLRILLAFVAIACFSLPFYYAAAALLLTITVIYMDSLDGYLARRLGVASDFGALFDITGDRIVEHIFWIYFAFAGMIGVWVPIVIVTRSFLVDTVRSVAFSHGKTPFGEKTMMLSPVTRFLVASPFSRSSYAVTKVAAFVLIGGLITLNKAEAAGLVVTTLRLEQSLEFAKQVLVYLAVTMNLIRGLPVLWDSREYLFTKMYPKQLKDED
jgi:CDP-diacylglycerol--glycerol-3-phosphate 3-phosphatidyltransferase